MAIALDAIPTAFRPGFEKARAIDPVRAEAYVRNTMVVDPIADAAVASLADRSHQEQHRLIEAGVNHEKEALKQAPRELQDFFEFMDSPPDDVRFQREIALEGARAFHSSSDLFIAAIVAKGLVENASTLMGQSFLATGYTVNQGAQRMRTSLKQVLESMLPGGLEWYGDGWKLTVRARLVHAQARRNVSAQPNLWNIQESGVPLSMAHTAYAVATFASGVLSALRMLGVHPSRLAREGYVHNWRYIGWLLGVPEDVLLKDEADGLALIKAARICEPPPNVDSVIMAHTFINSSIIGLVGREDEAKLELWRKFAYGVMRAILGNELSDQLDFPKQRTFGLLAALRWKRRFDRLIGRAPSKADNFITLLEATETVLGNYELPEGEYA